MKALWFLGLFALSINAFARGPAIVDDVAGIRLGDTRDAEAAVSKRAKPWLRVYYDDQGRVEAVRYTQPGLSNEVSNQRALVNRVCNKYGTNTFCDNARRTINDSQEKFIGFTSLYTVEGGYLTARVGREDAFSFFPRLKVDIELRREGFEFP